MATAKVSTHSWIDIGRLTDPVVHPQPWDTPEEDNVQASKHLTGYYQTCNHDCHTHITQQDQRKFILLVEDGILAKVEMRNLCSFGTTVLLSGQVEQKVSRPSKQLVNNIVPQAHNWRILCQLGELDVFGMGSGSHVSSHP